MAKQLINPAERHFEKGLLGLAGLLLIGVIVQYLLTSPNQLELDGQKVTPGTIDERLSQKAASIQERIRNANVDVDVPEKLYPAFEKTIRPIQQTPLPARVAIGPDIPQVDQAGTLVGQAKLVEVTRLDKPQLTSGRSTFEVVDKLGAISFVTSNWVTISSLFDVKIQTETQRLAYGATRSNVLFGPVEIQRRRLRNDGSWSENDWEYVTPWPVEKIPQVPNITVINNNGKDTITRDNQTKLDHYYDLLRESEKQLGLLRPLMHSVILGTPWSFSLAPTTSYRDVLMQDDEYLFPKEPPSANPVDRYDLGGGGAVVQAVELIGAKKHAQDIKEGYRYLELAKKNHSVDDALRAYNLGLDIKADKSASPSMVKKAEKLMAKAEQAETDANIWIQQHGQAIQAGGQGNAPLRERLPLQLVWTHDAHEGSLESGGTYQYRIHALIYNRLVGEPMKFANPQDATLTFVEGDWSEPSDPITIPPDIEFFVTSADVKRQEIGIVIYRWFQGVWVKGQRRFKFKVGDDITGESSVKIPSLEVVGESANATAEFDTNATVIDIDFNRSFRDRKTGGKNRKGVKFGQSATATALIYVDQFGEIHERIIPLEKGHPSKKTAKSREWKP